MPLKMNELQPHQSYGISYDEISFLRNFFPQLSKSSKKKDCFFGFKGE